MSDSTGETESTAGSPPESEAADRARSGLDSAAPADGAGSAVTSGELPDISDVVGATTGPLRVADDAAAPGTGGPADRHPADPTDLDPADSLDPASSLDPDAASGVDGGQPAATWSAPDAEDLREPVATDGPATPEPVAAAETVIVGPGTPDPPADDGATVLAADHPRPPDPPAADPPAADATVRIPVPDPTGVLPTAPVADGLSGPDPAGGPSPAVAAATAAATASGESPATIAPDPTGDLAVAAERPGRRRRRRRRRRRTGRAALLTVFGLIVVYLGAFAVDTIRSSDRVLRNTFLGTTPIGGMDRDELAAVLDGLDADLATVPLSVAVGPTTVDTDPASLGGRVDRDAVEDAALTAGRDGSVLARPVSWLGTFTGERTIEPVYTVDEAEAATGAASVITAALDAPVEPDLTLEGELLEVVPGAIGTTVDPQQLIDELPAALAGAAPYTLDLTPVTVEPELTDEQVQAEVDEATAATAEPVLFRVLDQTARVEPTELRSWIRLDTDGSEAAWTVSQQAAAEGLKPLFPSLGSEDQQARFSVVDGEPIIIPASETVVCCDEASLGSIRDELLAPLPVPEASEEGESDELADGEEDAPQRVITLEPEIVGADEGVAELESLGIVEEVSTFTTNHACCQNRVVNIQRFADLMTGVIIRPGEEFSLNDHVGRRTIEKGFVADGAIVDGILEPQVGGGVSQFATTFFNAAFFAGLDFNEYQSHSLYISRYPRGREATISFPRPDLSVTNTTPYGILVWPSYTSTSITVTFYSTPYVEVEAGELIRSANGECTRWTTPRIRTYPDGSVVEDSVFANYRPGEGLDCAGNPTRPETDPSGPTAPEPASDDEPPPPQPDPGAEPPPPDPDPGADPGADPGTQPQPSPDPGGDPDDGQP